MSERLVQIAEDFWNIRGDFKIAKILNIGTHASLVRRGNGRFVFLDAYTLNADIKQQVDALTDGGAAIEAIINLHPFHTVHIAAMHAQYPDARLYGTRRHHELFPDLPWQPELTESEEFAALFADDLAFSIPAGVDFISSNENLHFSSVLAYHPASKTIHSDDTLMYLELPGPMGKLRPPAVSFHLTLAKTLEQRAGAAQDFRDWAKHLAAQWGDAEILCAAHSAICRANTDAAAPLAEQIRGALAKVEKTLQRHEARYG